jgi:uncharacterized protein (TIGR00251 family)
MQITLYIQPGACKSEIGAQYNGYIKLKVKAKAIDGQANKCAAEFIANMLGIPKSSVSLIRGEKSRLKTFEFDETLIKNEETVKPFILI